MKIQTKDFIKNYHNYLEYIWPDNIKIYEDKIIIDDIEYSSDEIEIFPSKLFLKIIPSDKTKNIFINKNKINFIELININYENKYFVISIFFDNKEIKLIYHFLTELKKDIKTIDEMYKIEEYIKKFIKINFFNF